MLLYNSQAMCSHNLYVVFMAVAQHTT